MRHTLCVSVAQCRVTHVRELDVAFRAAVHEEVAVYRVELGSSDDLGQLLHIRRLDVDDVFVIV